MAVTVIALSIGSDSKDETKGTKTHAEITEKNIRDMSGLTVVVPEFRTAGTPPPLTKTSTTEKSTKTAGTPPPLTKTSTTEKSTKYVTESPFTYSKETDVATTPTTPGPPSTPPNRNKWERLLCTIGSKLSKPDMIPYDTLCDYLFYDSVYKNGPEKFDPKNIDVAP
ncbi:hypothetical protein MTO96_017527 [Rhipicephalus appendiculatus]